MGANTHTHQRTQLTTVTNTIEREFVATAYTIFLLDICEFFFVLCYSEYLIFVYVYDGVFFSAVSVYLIFMYNNVLLNIYVRSMLYDYTSKELYNFCTR